MQILSTLARETLLNIRGKKTSITVTLLMVSLSFVVFDVFLVVSYNLQQVLKQEQEEVGIELFLDQEIDESLARQMADRISGMNGVRSVYFISTAEAEAIFQVEFPDKGELLEALGHEFRLPASLQISLDPQWRTESRVETLVRTLEALDGVVQVVYGEDYLPGLTKLVNTLEYLVFFAGFVLVISISLVVANTVRLAVIRKILTVEIMSIVGAPQWFVRMPFLIEGGLIGFLGSFGGFLLTATVSSFISASVSHRFLPWSITGYVLVLGVIIGIIGSWIGLVSGIPRPRS